MIARGEPPAEDWALSGMIDDVAPFLADMRARRESGALATLIATEGPSPRPIGAQMAIAPSGESAGYVSGGCVEGSLALIGLEVIKAGAPRRVTFGAGSPYFDVKLLCGGAIEVFVEPVRSDDASWDGVLSARAARVAITRRVSPSGEVEIVAGETGARAGLDAAGWMFRRYEPQARIFIFGHDPVALALAALGKASGFETIVARRMGPPVGPGVSTQYRAHGPAETFAISPPDAWTAVVTTTHDLDADHEALSLALQAPALYVGALGSRARLAERLGKLEAAGVPWSNIKKLRAPIGLDIGAQTPFEIAIAILADIVRALRRPKVQ